MQLIRKFLLLGLFAIIALFSQAKVDSVLVTTSGNTICADSCKGFAIVQIFASSSTGPFKVTWKSNSISGGTFIDTVLSSDTIFNLCADQYTVQVLDVSDLFGTFPQQFTINNAPPLMISFSVTEPTCHDSLNGSIDISFVQHGTAPFRYQWSTGPNDTLNTLTGLGLGQYGLTIQDQNNCVFEDTIVINRPDTLKANIGGVHVTCRDACDGKVFVNPTGGNGNYDIQWNNGDTNLMVSNLCPGNFVATITDDEGCTVKDSFEVMQPDSLLATFDVTSTDCSGSCDGSITALATGGNRPYTYYWAGNASSDSTRNNLCAGSLSVSVTDINGCYYSEDVTVTEPAPLSIQPIITASSCGSCDGDISVTVSGGSGSYSYLWIGQKAQDTIPTIDSLCPGIYRLAITDDSACTDTFSIALSDDTSGISDLIFTSNSASCADVCDGSVIVSPLGGISPYSYSWLPGGQTDSVLTGICGGSYSVEVTDSAGCKRVETVIIGNESNMQLSSTTSFNGCFDQCAGEINLNVSGGIGPYTYTWSGMAGGSGSANLCPGSYPVKITDDNQCMLRDTIILTAPDSISIMLSTDGVSCYGQCSGSASVSASGGMAPYTYIWSNGMSGSSASGFCSGNHWVDITDASGCVKRKYFEITSSTPIQSNLKIYPADCGVSNGAASVSPTGGTPPYTFSWATSNHPLFNNDSIYGQTGIQTGPLFVYITDSLGCTKIDSFLIGEKGGPEFSVNIGDETCPNACDGIIEIQTPNVNGPILYSWTPVFPGGSTTSVRGGLCEGIYYVGVKAGGCQTVKQVKVKSKKIMDVRFTVNDPSCNSACDASVTASVSGGVPPYTYSWSNGASGKTVTNLCAGTYTLNIVDGLSCLRTASVEITDPELITVNLSTNNLKCANSCDGLIASSVTGGSPPYTYTWSTGGSASSAANLCAGTYWLTITDSKGCAGSDTISIGNAVPISVSFTSAMPGCNQSNGQISVIGSAGNGQPYTYLWSNGVANDTVKDLSAGIYTVTVQDNSGCEQDFTYYLGNSGGPSLSDTSYSASCAGSCDGAAKAMASSAIPPYFYQWYDPLMQTGDSVSGLCAGSYPYSVTDSNGCISFDTVHIDSPTEIKISASLNKISCIGADDGSIGIGIAGGMAPYDILWSNGDTTSAIDSLTPGTYTVIVTDSTGCQGFDTVEVNDPSSISISFNVSNTDCFSSCDGMAEAVVSGGHAPYSITWNDPQSQTGNIAVNLCAGYVTATVTDARGCQYSDSALINSPANITVTPTPANPTCKDGDNGSISLAIAGGTPPYRVLWSNGLTGASITGLTAGSYIATVIDANNCTFQNSYVLTNPTGISISFLYTRPACGQGTGSIGASVTGGSGSYSFSWNSIPGQNTAIASNLWPGVYEVTVTDNNTGCITTRQAFLDNNSGPSVSFTVTDESCPQACDGQVAASLPAGNYTFLWNDAQSQTDSIASNLCPGTYILRSTDTSTRCVSIDSVTVGSSDLKAIISGSSPASCYDNCDGSASVSAQGGTLPYQYSWNTVPAQNNQTASGLCAGNYTGTVTDSTGCSVSASVQVSEPDSISIQLDILSQASCPGSCDGRASAMVAGGNKPYTYFWNGNLGSNIAANLCEGVNTLEVVDSKGCSKVISFGLDTAIAIMANAVIIPPSCGEYDGSIRLNPTGGVGPYFYSWSNGATTSAIQNLFAGYYSVSISDINGCSKEFTFFLNNPNAPVLNFDKNTVKCNGDCNGVARVTPFGGVAPYTYIWDHVPVSTRDSLTDLCSGVYFVKVTDAQGCISFGTDTITEPPVLDGNLSKVSDGCGGACEGEANIVAIGGTNPYTYNWNSNPPQSSATATGLCAGFVQVILTDANDCEYTDSVEIIPPPELLIDSIEFANASCFTNNDGEATVYFQGGTAPVRFNWSDGQSTQTAADLGSGEIVIVLTDTNGCATVDTVNIGVQDTVLVEAFVDSFECIGNLTTLIGTSQGASIYQWFVDSSGTFKSIGSGDTLSYLVDDTVTVYLRGQNSANPPCFDLDTAILVGIPAPNIVASTNANPIEEGESAELLASPFLFNGTYAWSPAGSLNDSASIAPIATPNETTTYVVIGTNEFGCQGSDTITITVVEDESIINGFSPNGDGVNDTWVIPSLEDFPDVIVEVYNRWGEQVFRSEGYREPWDGRYEGTKLPGASYYYVIDYFGDGSKVETGAVTILY